MKRLKKYYLYIGIPVLAIALGAFFFYEELMGTMRGNPHPQINYLILILIVAGCIQMILHVIRINYEGRLIVEFSDALLIDKNSEKARKLIEDNLNKSDCDVAEVLELVLETHNNTVDSVQHSAIESEIARFSARQNRRLLLAGFMSGMMVGLGLLGTFIGLLGALTEISKLIGSFSASSGMSDPLAAVNDLVTRLTEPMKAMGVAFSASLFGVLGSLIMSMLMVFIKSATVELVSLLETRVSKLTDLGDGAENQDVLNTDGLSTALTQLAQHSPVLKGLVLAMDQSEKKVRLILNSVQELIGHIQQNTQSQTINKNMLEHISHTQNTQLNVIEELRSESLQLANVIQNTTEMHKQMLEKDELQRQILQASLQEHSKHNQVLMEMQNNWLRQYQDQKNDISLASDATKVLVKEEREAWLEQIKNWAEKFSTQHNQSNLSVNRLDDIFSYLNKQSRQSEEIQNFIKSEQNNLRLLIEKITLLNQQIEASQNNDISHRAELLHQFKLNHIEHSDRYEQLIHLLVDSLKNISPSKNK